MDKINQNIVGFFKNSLNNLQFFKPMDINQRDHLILISKLFTFEDLSYREEIVEAIRALADMVDIKSKILVINLILAMAI